METDAENLEDLEARLYGQVHHESVVSDALEQLQANPTNNKMVLGDLDKTSSCRYWNKEVKKFGPKRNINPFAGFPRSGEKNPPEENITTSRALKPFRPYVPYICKNEVIPDASGDDPEPKGSSSQLISDSNFRQDNRFARNRNKNAFNRNMSKLNNALKYQLKKMRANQVREKQKERQNVRIETIVVASSDEDDDVVEIPVPAPATVTIDSSGESENEDDSEKFLKPHDKPISRCVSPSSVISDDFIGQTDRSRIMQKKDVADDEDLIFLQQTVDSCVYQNKHNEDSEIHNNENDNLPEQSDFVSPKKKKTQKKTDYNVTHSNFRAIDVYESESSDMPDYDKDKETASRIILRSDEETDKERTKKLTKRRKSGSAKESEANESSDSEDEQESVAKTGIPFIMRGEAVESCKENRKRPRQVADTDPSDKEFINMLATISQPKNVTNELNESDISVGSVEDITARDLVEEVLNKNKRSKTKRNEKNNKTVESEAVPLDTSVDIEKILDSIDKMESVNPSEAESEKCDIEEYTGEEEILSVSDVIKEQNPIAPDNNGLYTVYTHGKNIGWSEEMSRFYNQSWGGENFKVNQVKRLLDASARWTIYTEDKFPKMKRFSNLKCYNCCEYGHTRPRCPKPRKNIVCYMCGEEGHLEPRCPNTLCLRCGNKTNVFTKNCNICRHENYLICPICKIRGHSTQLCPDKWRRYHSTTEANEYPNKKMHYNERKYCCICAQAGHLSEHCRSALRFLEYPPSVSEIKSYAKAYDDNLIKHPLGKNVTGYSLISRPCDGVLFKFSSEITIKKYYGRFLNAVGLDHLMSWTKKRDSSKKRKSESVTEDEPRKKAQKKNYVLNPFAKNMEETIKSQTRQVSKNIEEEHPSSDITLNVVGTNEKRDEEIFKTPTVSPSTKTIQTSEPLPKVQEPQSQKHDETTNTYTAFSKNINNNQSTPNHDIRKCREMGPLPDFIPLIDSDNDDDDMEPKKLFGKCDATEDDIVIPLDEDVPCEAKIYLTKFHSKFLLSPEGSKYLAENSEKFDVKTKIEWTSVGNTLTIDGLPPKQDKFHTQLLETFRNLSDQTNRRELEKSQKVPKRTDMLVKFLQENILQLDKTLGNVIDLYKRLKNVQNLQTKTGWKTAEKTRRTLNMILMGQTGLRKGKENLEALVNNLKTLQQSKSMELVPDKMRHEIGENWRYIFSSQQHANYGELIQEYMALKKKNELPKLNLNYKLLGGRVLDVSLTDEQKQQFNASIEKEELKIDEKNAPDPPKFPKEEKTSEPITVQIQNRKPRQFNRRQQFRQRNFNYGRNFHPRTFVSDKIGEISRGWKNHYQKIFKQIGEPPVPRREMPNKTAEPSIFWSRECIKFIDECLSMNSSASSVSAKLYRVQEKARQGLLCHNDYKALLRLYSVLKGKAN